MMESTDISLTLPPASGAEEWSICHVTATFMADCVEARLTASERRGRMTPVEAASAINFILNELLENAFKYGQAGDIKVSVEVGDDEVHCQVSHPIAPHAIPKLREELRRLDDSEPGELLRQRVEENAGGNGSRLGYLTILAVYGARMSWQLEAASPNTTCLTTQAQLPI